ncbi:hypothetical protein [Mycoplasmopsis glycophila]|uniref:Uncharacterized protein n=2 Tax=Mycoplasmopsis glycophila TaxID=171285 RepID=A0A449AVR2_9BACT|nr:hypothetical protein [Mycoplasmopsis glycophila]VEU70657.1 Uncharacterised protein [Mycoplasmopsis glycophila]
MNKENILKLIETFDFDVKDINVYETDLRTSETLRNSVNLLEAIQDFHSQIENASFKQISNLKDLDEFLTNDIIHEVAQWNINIYDFELGNNAFFKLEYLEENGYFDDALETVNNDKQFQEQKTIGLLKIAEFEILKECLYSYKEEMLKHLFENITQNQFEKEYELENNKEMTL